MTVLRCWFGAVRSGNESLLRRLIDDASGRYRRLDVPAGADLIEHVGFPIPCCDCRGNLTAWSAMTFGGETAWCRTDLCRS